MANSSPFDGTGWPTTLTPTGDEPHGNANQEIFDLRQGIKKRMDYEHEALTGSAAPDAGGRHKAGSAVAFFQAAKPPRQVGGVTTLLNAGDNGRLWIDKNNNNRLYVWDATDFETCAPNMDETTLEANSNLGRIKALGVGTAHLAEAAVTLAKLGTGAPLIEIGEYTGSGVNPRTVTGLPFQGQFILILEQGVHSLYVAFQNQKANPLALHESNQSNAVSGSSFDSTGFFDFNPTSFDINTTNARVNASGVQYSFIMVAVKA